MPSIEVVFYKDEGDSVPVLDWLSSQPLAALIKCRARIDRLRDCGHELRRPEAENLGSGIYELRARAGNVNYRILYFFHGRTIAVLACGLTKERVVPPVMTALAISRKREFEARPESHTHVE